MSVSLLVAEQAQAEPTLLWDTTWDGFVGDWTPDATTKGFRARSPLHTAILLCLMSDRRAGAQDFIPDGTGDPRGWAGDALDPMISPLGSRLWQLRRRELTQEVADLAVLFAREALQTLIEQKAVASFDISAVPNFDEGRLELTVNAYRESDTAAVGMNFWLLWTGSNGLSNPIAP